MRKIILTIIALFSCLVIIILCHLVAKGLSRLQPLYQKLKYTSFPLV